LLDICLASEGNGYQSEKVSSVRCRTDTHAHAYVCPWRRRDAKEAAEKAAKEAAAADAKKQTRKQAKNFALMSFGVWQ
jgi:exopolysaccharide biosynthesis protein